MKIKIFDLLNKIYNNDNIPKRILYDNQVWRYNDATNDFKNEADGSYLFIDYISFYSTIKDFLESELEIIAEPQKIEKLCEYNRDLYVLTDDPDLKIKYSDDYNNIAVRINEIIDVVNKLVKDNEH